MAENGEVKVTGFRSMVSRAQHGGYVKTVFSLVGDNIEWAAPEVMAQVNFSRLSVVCLSCPYLDS